MKNIRILLTFAVATLMLSCGDVRNPEDAEHGGLFRVDSFDSGENAGDVDTVAQLCESGELEVSGRAKHAGQVTLSNLEIGQGGIPTDIRVERYTIDYFPLDGGGALSGLEYITSEIVPGGGNATFNIEMVPLITKGQFRSFYDPITRTTTQNTFRYELDYEFIGFNEYDVEVRTNGSTVLTLGNFIICD